MGVVVTVLVGAQGGYFPTSWGLATIVPLWALALWLGSSARTDAGPLDAMFLGLLALFVVWVGASIAWSAAPASSVLELERSLVLVAGLAAFLALARRRDLGLLCAALLVAITAICIYALATRLYPERFGIGSDRVVVYRLAEPIGYWNGLGIFSAIGLLLALALVAEAERIWVRAAAAATMVALAPTLYFTYSRASWLTLAIGLGAAVAIGTCRLRLVTWAAIAALPSGLAVLSASRSPALTNRNTDLAAATRDGHRLSLVFLVLVLLAATMTAVAVLGERRIRVPRAVRVGYGALLCTTAGALVVAAFVHYGGPGELASRAWDSFESGPRETTASLDDRLFTLSSNGRLDLWSVAWDTYSEERLTGTGAGSFERFWQSRADASFKVRDAHGLYVETLAELGPLGLGLLISALAMPVLAALVARRARFVPAVLGGYVAFLVHAGVDWVWELSGVALTALLVGSLLVVAKRTHHTTVLPAPVRVAGVAAAIALSVGAGVAGLGNAALSDANEALDRDDRPAALVESRRARALMPWSPAPWIATGEAQLLDGDAAGAVRSLERALELDPGEWRAWLDLAFATRGARRATAFERARALYPRSAEIAEARELLGLSDAVGSG